MSGPYLPPRREGSHHDTVSMRCLDTDATNAFVGARDRFYAINRWRELNGGLRTDFQLCDEAGEAVERLPQVGDTIRINMVGPGSPSGAGYDWVSITQLAEGDEPLPFVSLTLVPCAKPGSGESRVAHFYEAGATNTLVLRQLGDCLLAEAHGRNEVPNTHQVPVTDRLRNEAIAVLGKVGMGKIQWQDWADGLVSVV